MIGSQAETNPCAQVRVADVCLQRPASALVLHCDSRAGCGCKLTCRVPRLEIGTPSPVTVHGSRIVWQGMKVLASSPSAQGKQGRQHASDLSVLDAASESGFVSVDRRTRHACILRGEDSPGTAELGGGWRGRGAGHTGRSRSSARRSCSHRGRPLREQDHDPLQLHFDRHALPVPPMRYPQGYLSPSWLVVSPPDERARRPLWKAAPCPRARLRATATASTTFRNPFM